MFQGGSLSLFLPLSFMFTLGGFFSEDEVLCIMIHQDDMQKKRCKNKDNVKKGCLESKGFV
jgi:hypothetical protein